MTRKILRTQFLLLLLFAACKNTPDSKIQPALNKESGVDSTENQPELENPETHTDTLRFTAYDDNGDNFLLFARNKREELCFINNTDTGRTYLTGDLIEIRWKKDTLFLADAAETPEMASWIISTKKLKDVKTARFRANNKALKYNWSGEVSYTQSFLEELYLIVENYIANTQNKLINQYVADNTQLEYSIEQRTRAGKTYTVLGIAIVFEHRVNTLQWLYYEYGAERRLYEYDLPNDKLIELLP